MNIVKKRDKPIGTLLKDFISRNEGIKRGMAKIDIEKIYRAEMGPVVSSYTEKIYLNGKKLYIHIQSAPLRSELMGSKESLMTLLNEALGDALIQEIHFR
ncbi:MAG: DUF721 domain-containing protein [Saprospiraceae bacterium]|nr:DUF721 domain-containing protein [Saprospiraceae bacterium]